MKLSLRNRGNNLFHRIKFDYDVKIKISVPGDLEAL